MNNVWLAVVLVACASAAPQTQKRINDDYPYLDMLLTNRTLAEIRNLRTEVDHGVQKVEDLYSGIESLSRYSLNETSGNRQQNEDLYGGLESLSRLSANDSRRGDQMQTHQDLYGRYESRGNQQQNQDLYGRYYSEGNQQQTQDLYGGLETLNSRISQNDSSYRYEGQYHGRVYPGLDDLRQRTGELSVTGLDQTRDQYFQFRNETLSRVEAGICFEEVPTASLVRRTESYIPAGNGSDPTKSRIQVCCKGYERNIHNFYKCDPVCENDCVNGLCVAPNTCRCFPDFVTNLGGFCIPTCPIGCGNGECNPDRSCQCKPGFKLEPGKKFCVPHCEGGCGGVGNCTAPDTCSCPEGYHVNADKKCVPFCESGCPNGICIKPNQCICKPGYNFNEAKECIPVCNRACPTNAKCIAPETCACTEGFLLNPEGTECRADCDPPCLNGECVGPNRCECWRGYQNDRYAPHRCIANCPGGCPNGVCSGPGLCICNVGFVKDRSVKGSQACVPRV